jgi:hypothetical protein
MLLYRTIMSGLGLFINHRSIREVGSCRNSCSRVGFCTWVTISSTGSATIFEPGSLNFGVGLVYGKMRLDQILSPKRLLDMVFGKTLSFDI